MKKIFALLTVLCMLTALFCGCGDATNKTSDAVSDESVESKAVSDESAESESVSDEESTDEASDGIEEDASESDETTNIDDLTKYTPVDEIEIPKGLEALEISVAANMESDVLKCKATTSFQTPTYQDDTVPKTKTFSFMGKEYTLEYKESSRMDMMDLYVHTYSVQETEYGSIMFDAKTDKPIRIFGMPYDGVMPVSEDAGIERTKQLISDLGYDIDFSEYTATPQTRVCTTYEKGVGMNTIDGFISLAENQELLERRFNFKKTVGGYNTSEEISVKFAKEYLNISIIVNGEGYWNNATEVFAPYADMKEAIAYDFISKNKNEKYVISGISAKSSMLFVYDGIPYLCIVSDVQFHLKDYENEDDFGEYVPLIVRVK